jgi:predicted permease
MPEEFSFTTDIEQLWLPLDEVTPRERGERSWHGIARLAPGVAPARASAELAAISRRLAERHPDTNSGWTARATPLRAALVPTEVRAAMFAMLGAVTFVLLIACANVANLMLGRTAARQRELAVRAALGAGGARIARLLLSESLLLGIGGGMLGILLAVWGLQATLAAIPYPFPGWMTVEVSWRVVLYTFLVSVASGLAFGLVPAFQAGRSSPVGALVDGARGSGGPARTRLRSVLVGAQLALSVVLLAGAGLMMTSFLQLQRVNPGFDSRPLLAAQAYAGGDRYDAAERRVMLWDEVLRRARALPGVTNAALISHAPLSGWNTSSGLEVEGLTFAAGEMPSAERRTVVGDYFRTIDVAPIAGRVLTTAESLDSTSRLVVINRGMAERFWPGQSAVGRRISIGGEGDARWLTVIGVVPDVKQRGLDRPVQNQLYVPFALQSSRTMTLLLRTAGDPAALAPAVRRTVATVDPTVPVLEAMSMPAILRRSLWQQRVFGGLFTAFAAAALLLAAIGLYGVVSYATEQRTREIGVRIALGARVDDVYRLVLGRGLLLVGASLGVGVLLALGTTRALASQLHGVSPNDPILLGGVVLTLAVVALAASWLPARRATRVDPAVALRAE